MLHQNLTKESWASKPLEYQMGNIGAEVSRFLGLIAKQQRMEEARNSLARAFELLDLSIAVQTSLTRKKELELIKNQLLNIFHGGTNTSTPEQLNGYFLPFAILARK